MREIFLHPSFSVLGLKGAPSFSSFPLPISIYIYIHIIYTNNISASLFSVSFSPHDLRLTYQNYSYHPWGNLPQISRHKMLVSLPYFYLSFLFYLHIYIHTYSYISAAAARTINTLQGFHHGNKSTQMILSVFTLPQTQASRYSYMNRRVYEWTDMESKPLTPRASLYSANFLNTKKYSSACTICILLFYFFFD